MFFVGLNVSCAHPVDADSCVSALVLVHVKPWLSVVTAEVTISARGRACFHSSHILATVTTLRWRRPLQTDGGNRHSFCLL